MAKETNIPSGVEGQDPEEGGYHVPVMLQETVEALNIRPAGIYVDCTFGGGGDIHVPFFHAWAPKANWFSASRSRMVWTLPRNITARSFWTARHPA